jgi:manganese/zinc/iron transport system substrate-binding protein
MVNRRTLLVCPLLLAASVLLSGCPRGHDGGRASGPGAGKVRVVATIGMLADAAKNVGGDRVDVEALMGPGVDPHLYRATARDVQSLDEADIILYGGLELEGRMTEIFEKMTARGKKAVAVGEAVPKDLLRQPPEFRGKYDPHIWFDVLLWKRAVESVRDALAEYAPEHANTFRANAQAYLKELDTLHQYVQKEVAKIPESQRVLITAHDAFGYFGRQYGVEVRGLQGTSTAAEAGAGDVRRLAQVIADRRVRAIFVESSVPQSTIEAVQAAVRARGWGVRIGGQLFSDALGAAGTPEGTYVGMVRHNVDTMVKALR